MCSYTTILTMQQNQVFVCLLVTNAHYIHICIVCVCGGGLLAEELGGGLSHYHNLCSPLSTVESG